LEVDHYSVERIKNVTSLFGIRELNKMFSQ